MSSPALTGRFAPTPSGQMHLGNAFAALLAWLSARAGGGRILLRIEDLDPARTSPDKTQALLEDLRWLGLDWDEGPGCGGAHAPYEQSRRGDFYARKLQALQQQGLVYRCFCSRAQLHAANAPHASDGSYVYDGCCRRMTQQQADERSKTRAAALRLFLPDELVGFVDGCQGLFSQNLAQDTGDLILRRSDGVYAYHLAVCADDGEMGVGEVVRGRDLLASTPAQIWLLRQLGYTPPKYYHVPLLLAPDGRRLSKREGDLSLAQLRRQQPDPRPLLGVLAHLAGLLPNPQPLSAAQLVPLFSWGSVPREDIMLTQDFFDAVSSL